MGWIWLNVLHCIGGKLYGYKSGLDVSLNVWTSIIIQHMFEKNSQRASVLHGWTSIRHTLLWLSILNGKVCSKEKFGPNRPEWMGWRIFKASALWADTFYKSICQSVCLLVHFLRYCLTVFLPPLPEVGCLIFLEIRNPWGKVMERSGLTFEHFCLEVV